MLSLNWEKIRDPKMEQQYNLKNQEQGVSWPPACLPLPLSLSISHLFPFLLFLSLSTSALLLSSNYQQTSGRSSRNNYSGPTRGPTKKSNGKFYGGMSHPTKKLFRI
jgi:hypothetical protein